MCRKLEFVAVYIACFSSLVTSTTPLKSALFSSFIMLKDFKPRPYQVAIFNTATMYNTLVVLPTGLGKTAIAMLAAARRKLNYPNKKILFLAPTKPLVEQQLESFQRYFEIDTAQFALFTGGVAPAKRHKLWEESQFIFSTPQTIENDILGGKISLEDVSLMVIDEAHRATGDYSYVFLAKNYIENADNPRLMALTASPGTDEESIKELMTNLSIERIEYRKPDDIELTKYTQETNTTWEHVELPEKLKRIISFLEKAYDEKIAKVNSYKQEPIKPNASKVTILKLQALLHSRASRGETSSDILHSISLLAEALKIQHAIELAETQTIYALHEYMFNILVQARTSKTKAVKNLAIDPNFLSSLALVRDARKEKIEHPKLQKLIDKVALLMHQKKDAKFLIFTQFRDTAFHLESLLSQLTPSKLFFGQAKKNGIGFSQKEQKKVLDEFRAGEFSCLIATSVAEEGLDIPSVDHVFFYEPIPSAIRSVQRRGRTGRHTKGFVTVFVTRATRDETYRWVAFHKEKRMYQVLAKLTKTLPSAEFFTADNSQKQLTSFKSETKKIQRKQTLKVSDKAKIQIIADHREKGSPVLKNLLDEDINLTLKQLNVGDFLLSKDCCVEFKNVRDFVDSVVDGRLLSQLRSLVQYSKPLLIIEGDQEWFANRRVSQEALNGMFATITTSYRIPILRTFNPRETAKLLLAIAKKEQNNEEINFTFHSSKPLVDRQLQEYVISSLPQVGGALAKALLEKFDSVKSLADASVDDLKKIPLIGEKKAQEIYRIINKSYKDSKEEFSKDILPE